MPRSEEPTASTVAACAARESSTSAASTEPGKTDTDGSAGRGAPPRRCLGRGSTRIGAGTLGGAPARPERCRRPARGVPPTRRRRRWRAGTCDETTDRLGARRSPAEPTRNTGPGPRFSDRRRPRSRKRLVRPAPRADRKCPRSAGTAATRRHGYGRMPPRSHERSSAEHPPNAGGRARCIRGRVLSGGCRAAERHVNNSLLPSIVEMSTSRRPAVTAGGFRSRFRATTVSFLPGPDWLLPAGLARSRSPVRPDPELAAHHQPVRRPFLGLAAITQLRSDVLAHLGFAVLWVVAYTVLRGERWRRSSGAGRGSDRAWPGTCCSPSPPTATTARADRSWTPAGCG